MKLDPFDFIYIVLKGDINAFKLSEKRRLSNIMNVRIMSEVKYNCSDDLLIKYKEDLYQKKIPAFFW